MMFPCNRMKVGQINGEEENMREKGSDCIVTQGFFNTNHQLKGQQKAYKIGLKV